MQTRDIVVIGGGPAGYVAAVRAAQLGVSVTLVEERELGGTCLNRGCIPTKTLVDTAKMIGHIPDGKKRGVVYSGTYEIDMKAALNYKNRLVRRMSAGIGVLLREHGVEVLSGCGTVSDGLDGLVVNVSNGEAVRAKKIIVATGTNPIRLPIPGFHDSRVLTTDNVLNLDFVPKRLAVLGAGVAGVEFSQIFKTFGSEVHIIEALDRVCPFLDAELSRALEKSCLEKKIKCSLGTKLEKIESHDENLVLHLSDGQTLEVTHLLSAVGRAPDCRAVESLNLKQQREYVVVNDWFQSSHPDIYVPGDLNGSCMLAHAAYRMGEIAADHAVASLKNESPEDIPKFCTTCVPGAIYTDPEVGYVGLTEEKAKEKHENIMIGRFPLAANGRATVAGTPEGFVKAIASSKTEKIVGVHIFGLYASELVNEAAVAVTLGLTIGEWSKVIHAHPTVSESLAEAAADAKFLSLHLPPKKTV